MASIINADNTKTTVQTAGVGAESINDSLMAMVLGNSDMFDPIVSHLDLKSTLALGGVSIGMREVAVKSPYTIKVNAKNLDEVSAVLKGKGGASSILGSPKILLDLSWISEAQIILLKSLLQDYPEFANRITSLDFLGHQALSKDLLAAILACTKQLKVLNLYNTGLTELPPELGKLMALTSLNVSNNRLTALPPELGQLTALRTLNVSRNYLTALPAELGQLTALRALNVSRNYLTALPPELGQLSALALLSASHNRLTVLLPEIGECTALRALDVSNNLLVVLPPELEKLGALTYLYAFCNQLTILPPEIGKLMALTHLSVFGNWLIVLPISFRHLHSVGCCIVS